MATRTEYPHSGIYVGLTDNERLTHLTDETFGSLVNLTVEISHDEEGARYVVTGCNHLGVRVKRTMRVTDDGYMSRYYEVMER